MAEPMTSEQKKQVMRLLEDGVDSLKLDKDQAQVFATSGGQFQQEVKDLMLAFVTGEQKYKLARAILGNDFISPKEATEAWGFAYTKVQLQQFAETLPDVKVLQWLREHNYALIPGPAEPKALLDVRSMQPAHFYSKKGGWYANDGETFSRNDKVAVKWLALRKDAVPNSFGKNWEEQTALLSTDEYVPNAGEVSWGVATYYKVRDIYLLPNFYVRTSSVNSGGARVVLGSFVSRGLAVGSCFGGGRDGNLGVASARKL